MGLRWGIRKGFHLEIQTHLGLMMGFRLGWPRAKPMLMEIKRVIQRVTRMGFATHSD